MNLSLDKMAKAICLLAIILVSASVAHCSGVDPNGKPSSPTSSVLLFHGEQLLRWSS